MSGTLIVLAGGSGVGKSTLINRVYPDAYVASSDKWRGILYGDEDAQRNMPLTFRMLDRQVTAGLRDGDMVVSDQTSLTPYARKGSLETARKTKSDAHLVFIRASLQEMIEGNDVRHAAGGRRVPTEALERHYKQALKLETQINSLQAREGWKSVQMVDRPSALSMPPVPFLVTPEIAQARTGRLGTLLESEYYYLRGAFRRLSSQLTEAGLWEGLSKADWGSLPEVVAEPLQVAWTHFTTISVDKAADIDTLCIQAQRIADTWDEFTLASTAAKPFCTEEKPEE